jgi:hypothetical protein
MIFVMAAVIFFDLSATAPGFPISSATAAKPCGGGDFI